MDKLSVHIQQKERSNKSLTETILWFQMLKSIQRWLLMKSITSLKKTLEIADYETKCI